jgi:F0F1-type ATP synthase membrane subunit b/b'
MFSSKKDQKLEPAHGSAEVKKSSKERKKPTEIPRPLAILEEASQFLENSRKEMEEMLKAADEKFHQEFDHVGDEVLTALDSANQFLNESRHKVEQMLNMADEAFHQEFDHKSSAPKSSKR